MINVIVPNMPCPASGKLALVLLVVNAKTLNIVRKDMRRLKTSPYPRPLLPNNPSESIHRRYCMGKGDLRATIPAMSEITPRHQN